MLHAAFDPSSIPGILSTTPVPDINLRDRGGSRGILQCPACKKTGHTHLHNTFLGEFVAETHAWLQDQSLKTGNEFRIVVLFPAPTFVMSDSRELVVRSPRVSPQRSCSSWFGLCEPNSVCFRC